MSEDDEIRQYLWDLLDHESGCAMEKCPACLTAQQVYELVRKRIFTGAVYPGVAIGARTANTRSKSLAWPRARRAATPH